MVCSHHKNSAFCSLKDGKNASLCHDRMEGKMWQLQVGVLSSLLSNHWETDYHSFCSNFNLTITQRDSKSRERKLLSSKASWDKSWQGCKSPLLKSAVLDLDQSSYDSLYLKVLNKMSNHCHGHCHQLCHHPGCSAFPGLSLHCEHRVIPANTYWTGIEKAAVKNYSKICKKIILSLENIYSINAAVLITTSLHLFLCLHTAWVLL